MAERAFFRGYRLPSALRFVVLTCLLAVSGCSGVRPDFVPALFGVDDAGRSAYILGKVPEPKIGPRDTVVGLAAGFDGQCIYRRAGSGYRFRSACPDGYRLGGPSR